MFCLGNCALGPSGHDRRPAARPALPRPDRRAHRGVAAVTDACTSPATPRPSRWAPTRSRPRSRRPASSVVRNGSRGHALARAAGRGRRPTRAGSASRTSPPSEVATWPRGSRRPGRPPRPPERIGLVDEHPWLRRPAAGHLRPRRASSTRLGRATTRRTVAGPGCAGPWRCRPPRSSRRSPSPACAAAAAPASPPASSGAPCSRPPADLKFVACNFDEGDSGTFADRMLVEGDPFTLIEGMTIAAHAVGASEGYVYVRSEYPHAVAALRRAIDTAYTHGFLGSRHPRQRAAPSTCTCGSAPAPTSAARSPRCSTASRASAARSAPSRRSPRSPGCSAARPRSTTCSRSARCR